VLDRSLLIATLYAELGGVQNQGRVVVCLSTHSRTIPYRLVSMTQEAADRRSGREQNHAPAFDPWHQNWGGYNWWGDIIPSSSDDDGKRIGGNLHVACNWDDWGKTYLYNDYDYRNCTCR